MKHVAKQQKDIVNHSYGSSLLNANRLINTKLVSEEQVLQTVGCDKFIDAEACGFEQQSDLWEMVTKKSAISTKISLALVFKCCKQARF